MCFGGNDKVAKESLALQQQQAEEARQEKEDEKAKEAQRQTDIRSGQGAINDAFGGYGDDYYTKYAGDYSGYYKPQLDDQYDISKENLTNDLANKGLTQSSVAATLFGRLQKKYDDSKLQIDSQATDAGRTLRQNVEKAKNDLYSLNQSSADPSAISNRAASQATALVAPVSYAPLGDVFSAALGNAGTFLKASQGTGNSIFGSNSGSSIYGTGKSGSGKVVG